MKLTRSAIRNFEKAQADHGTETALYNVLWTIAADLLKDIGCTRIHTSKGKS